MQQLYFCGHYFSASTIVFLFCIARNKVQSSETHLKTHIKTSVIPPKVWTVILPKVYQPLWMLTHTFGL